MTANRPRGHRLAATAAGVAALVGAGMFTATPASAHTPTWSVDCSTVSVDLTAYNPGVQNTVKITAGGEDLLAATPFKSEYHKKLQLPEHSSPLKVRLVVKAGDGDQFSRDEVRTSPVCAGSESPSPAPSPSQSSSAAPAPSAPAEEPSSSAPAAPKPEGGGRDLAETGSSSATPVIAGVAGVVIVAGAALVFATRKRRSVGR